MRPAGDHQILELHGCREASSCKTLILAVCDRILHEVVIEHDERPVAAVDPVEPALPGQPHKAADVESALPR